MLEARLTLVRGRAHALEAAQSLVDGISSATSARRPSRSRAECDVGRFAAGSPPSPTSTTRSLATACPGRTSRATRPRT